MQSPGTCSIREQSNFTNLVIQTSCQFTNQPNREISRGVFQNRGVCGQVPLLSTWCKIWKILVSSKVMQNKWFYIKTMLNIFNVNGNTITGVCSQIQESVYRTLIEACQVPGVLMLSGTYPLLFFSCSIFLHLSPTISTPGTGSFPACTTAWQSTKLGHCCE